MESAIRVFFGIAGLINCYPLIGVLGSVRLATLYGVSVDEVNLLILMRHRAVLFGLIGLFLIGAAFQRDWQMPALVGGLISMLSFVVIARLEGQYNPKLRTVVIADLIASLLLGVAGVLRMLSN